MGLTVDDDGTDSPSPPPLSISPPPISTALQWMNAIGNHPAMFQPAIAANQCRIPGDRLDLQAIQTKADTHRMAGIHQYIHHPSQQHHITATTKMLNGTRSSSSTRKRQFNIASLLAPDSHESDERMNRTKIDSAHCDMDEDVDVEESEYIL